MSRHWATIGLAVLLAAFGVAWGVWMEPVYNADFSAYWSAGRLALQGGDPYYDAVRMSDGRLLPRSTFRYPPASLTFWMPLGLLPYHQARQVWLALEIAMLVGALMLSGLSLRTALAWGCVLLAVARIAFYPLYAHLERGQAELCTLFFVALAWRLWDGGRAFGAGAAVAAAGMVKPPVLLLLAVPLLARAYRAAAGALAGVLLLTVASATVVGFSLHSRYWRELFPTIARTHQLPDEKKPAPLTVETAVNIEGRSYPRGTRFQSAMGSVFLFEWRERGRALFWNRLLGTLAVALTLTIIYRGRRHSDGAALRRWQWITAMLTVLLWHPMTWLMTYVWVVVPAALVWKAGGEERRRFLRSPAVLAALVLIGVSELVTLPLMQSVLGPPPFPLWPRLLVYSRVAFGGLLLWLFCLRQGPLPARPDGSRAALQ